MVSRQHIESSREKRREALGLSPDCSWIIVNAIEVIELYLENFRQIMASAPLEDLFNNFEEPEFLWCGKDGQISGSHSMTGPYWKIKFRKGADALYDRFNQRSYDMPGAVIMTSYSDKLFGEVVTPLFGRILISEGYLNPRRSIIEAFNTAKAQNLGLALHFRKVNLEVRFDAAIALVPLPSIQLHVPGKSYTWYESEASKFVNS